SGGKAVFGNSEVSGELFKHVMSAKEASTLRSGRDVLPSMHRDMVEGVAARQAEILRDNPATEFWIKSSEQGAVKHALSPEDIIDIIPEQVMQELGIKYTTSVPMANITDMVARAADLATARTVLDLAQISPNV